MKRLLLLFFLIAACLAANAQTLTVSMPTITATVGQHVTIPVTLTGASSTGVPISSANINITYDTAVLVYDSLTNFFSGTPKNQWFYYGNNGLISANWLEPSLLTVAVPNNTALFNIRFTYKGGSSPLVFTICEFSDAGYNIIPTTPLNGAVNALTHQVTFKVDMAKESISPSGVFLTGSFNNWSYTQTPMTLVPATSIYTVTLPLSENGVYQYRYSNGNTPAGAETVPASCGVLNGSGQYVRQITVANHDTVFSPVCFSMCGDCPASVTVTFRVDMQHETVSADGVHVAGSFNSWNYVQTPLTLSSGTIYTTSMTMEEGTAVEFRYANGNTAMNAETVPAACALNGNRYFTVPGADTTLSVFCYDSCVACGTAAQFTHVTFRVNMRTKPISPDGIHIAGTFQGWDPGATLMTHVGDSIYTYTDSLLAGSSVQYKFVNGNTTANYEIVPFACSSNGNRTLLVPVSDTVLIKICFGECDTCNITGLSDLPLNGLALFQNHPNPSQGITHIGYRIGEPGHLKISVCDFIGNTVSVLADGPCVPGSFDVPFLTGNLPAGIYFYNLIFSGRDGSSVRSKKMIVK